MSSDFSLFEDGYLFSNSSPDMVSSDLEMQFFSDPFVSFEDSPSDILQPISSNLSNKNFPTNSSLSLTTKPFSYSPSQELNNLSLGSRTQFQSLPINGITDFSVLDSLGVKSEESCLGFDSYLHDSCFIQPNNSFGTETVMQSFISKSLDQKLDFFFKPCFDSLTEAPIFQNQVLDSKENKECIGPMRRVCSTGDLQRIKTKESSSPLTSENSFMEENGGKVRRCSPEERKQRIHRYRNKRAHRNFNKTIKYACRKTLADSRPRVRGRFARNDATEEIPKVLDFNRQEEEEEDDEFWVEGLLEDEDEALIGGTTQHQYYKL